MESYLFRVDILDGVFFVRAESYDDALDTVVLGQKLSSEDWRVVNARIQRLGLFDVWVNGEEGISGKAFYEIGMKA